MRVANELVVRSEMIQRAAKLPKYKAKWIASRVYELAKKEHIKKFDKKTILSDLAKGFDKQDLIAGTVGFIDPFEMVNDNRVRHVIDWMESDRNLDLNEMRGIQTLDGLSKKADEHFDRLLKLDCVDDLKEKVDVHEIDNYIWVKIETEKGLRSEGKAMNHCVGGYYKKLDNINIYSLRDSQNWPHLTIEVKEDKVVQKQGRSGETEKYDDYFVKFIKKMGWEDKTFRPVRQRPARKHIRVGHKNLNKNNAKKKGNVHIWKRYADGFSWELHITPRRIQTTEPGHRHQTNAYVHHILRHKNNKIALYFGHTQTWGDTELVGYIIGGLSRTNLSGARYDRHCKNENTESDMNFISQHLDKVADFYNAYPEIADSRMSPPLFPGIVRDPEGKYTLRDNVEKAEVPEYCKYKDSLNIRYRVKKDMWFSSKNKQYVQLPSELLECKSLRIKLPHAKHEITMPNKIMCRDLLYLYEFDVFPTIQADRIIFDRCDCKNLKIENPDKIKFLNFKSCTNVTIPKGEYHVIQIIDCDNVVISPEAAITSLIISNSGGIIKKSNGPHKITVRNEIDYFNWSVSWTR